MVGRADELDAVERRLQAVLHGDGQTVIIAGEAGIGKSRLVAEVKRRADRSGYHTFEGRCFEPDAVFPYAPVIDLLQSDLARRSAETFIAELGPSVSAVSRLLPELLLVQPNLQPLPQLEPEDARRLTFRALTAWLLTRARDHPVLVVVEDLHWSDDNSLDFLLHLARHVAGERILVVLTYRSDTVGTALRQLLSELNRERLASELTLSALSRGNVDAMLRAIDRQDRRRSVGFADDLFAITEGNPFFVEEFLVMLDGLNDNAYTGVQSAEFDADPIRVPRSIEGVVLRRLTGLSPGSQRVLTLAAVAGRWFDVATLRELTGEDETLLFQHLKELRAAQLIVEESVERFAFRHALVREAVYGQLLARERQSLHRVIAEVVERRVTESLEIRLPALAYHFHAAGQWAKSIEYSRQMGDRARAMNAPRAAIEHYSHAVAAAEQLGQAPPIELLRARGQIYETRGEFDRAYADLARVLDSARLANDEEAIWQGFLDLGFLWLGRDYARAGEYFHLALGRAEHLTDSKRLAHTLNRLGNWHANMDQPRQGLELHQRALQIFRDTGDRSGIAETLDLLGVAALINGNRRQAVAHFEEAVVHFRALNEPRGIASVLATLAHVRSASKVYDTMPGAAPISHAALREVEEALALTRKIGWRPGEAYASCEQGACLAASGEYGGALVSAGEGLAIAEEVGHQEWISIAHSTLSLVYLDLLLAVPARQFCESAYSQAQHSGIRHIVGLAGALLASAYRLTSELGGAEEVLANLIDPEAPVETLAQAALLAEWTEIRLARGDHGAALRSADVLLAWAARTGGQDVAPRLVRLRGVALAGLGRAADAEAALRIAAEGAHEQQAGALYWQIQLARGKLLQAQGRHGEAEAAFADARASVDALAATVPDEALRETFRTRASAEIPPPRRVSARRADKDHFAGLTAREREVAVLIARGLSNREIAAALVVSERTVEAHTGRIRDKLEVTSRTQVAAWAVEHGLTGRGP
jgi:DNA-binding CsgD family transcriptional regulator/tetratricopeptide (TPR) repeat protein